MKFCDIPGHDEVKRRLKDMVLGGGRLPHALLLEGPVGAGKLSLARATAQLIHCTNPGADGEPCGECRHCLQHREFNQIDTIYSYPVVKGRGGSATTSDDYADEWRRMLAEQPWGDEELWLRYLGNENAQPAIFAEESVSISRKLSFTSHDASKKIVIMWLPERLNVTAANKLLKILEEPLEGVVFILTSDHPRQILPTVYSRLQRIEVPAYSEHEMAQWLMDAKGADAESARSAAALSGGNLIAAERALAARDGSSGEMFTRYCEMMRLAYQRDVRSLKRWSTDMASLGREGLIRWLRYASEMTRKNFCMNIGMGNLCAMPQDERQFSQRFSRFVTVNNTEGIERQLQSAAIDIAGNSQAKLVLFDMAVKIIMLIHRSQTAS